MIRPVLVALGSVLPVIETITGFYNFAKVDSGLTRSAQLPRKRLQLVVQTYGAKSLVSLRHPHPGKEWYDEEIRLCKELDVAHTHLGLSAKRPPFRDEVLAMINVARTYPTPMHVQCRRGADRTGLFAGIYEMVVNGKSPAEAKKQASLYFGNFLPYQRAFFDTLIKAGVNGNLEEWVATRYSPASLN